MAFPTSTTITDPFSGASASPPSANWSGNSYSTQSALQATGSGTCTVATPASGGSGAWLATAPNDADAGYQMTVGITAEDNFLLHFRLSGIGTSLNGYEVVVQLSTNSMLYLRVDAEVETLLGSTEPLPSTFADGDWIGGRMLGSTIQGYYSTAAGGINGFAAVGSGRTGLTEYMTGNCGICVGAATSAIRMDNWFLASAITTEYVGPIYAMHRGSVMIGQRYV